MRIWKSNRICGWLLLILHQPLELNLKFEIEALTTVGWPFDVISEARGVGRNAVCHHPFVKRSQHDSSLPSTMTKLSKMIGSSHTDNNLSVNSVCHVERSSLFPNEHRTSKKYTDKRNLYNFRPSNMVAIKTRTTKSKRVSPSVSRQ